MPSKKTLEHYLRQMRLIEEHREKWCEQNIRRHYRDLMKDLNEFLGNEYAKLAQDDQLTYEILHGKGEYARFIEEVEQKTNYFTGKAAKDIKETVKTTYQKAFEGMVKAVEKSDSYEALKINLTGLHATTPDVIKNAVKNTFLEDALEKNHKTIIYDIKQQIGIGLSQGDRMSTMARRISEQLDKDYKKATQIARTECHRVREAGYQDSSERINNILKDTDSDYVMVKVWKTMKDERVRPQYKAGKGKKKVIKMGNGANHMKMEGVMVLVDEKFKLHSGAMATSPGQSGVASEDINCRCYLSRDFMTKAEYTKLTGKSFVDENILKYETQEKELLDEKAELEKEKEKLEKRQKNLESYEYTGIWKDKVTPADYELKKDSIESKRNYYTNKRWAVDVNNDELSTLIDNYDQGFTVNDFNDYLKQHVGLSDRMAFGLDINSLNAHVLSDADEFIEYVEKQLKQYQDHLQGYLDKLDEFEAQGKTYLKLKKQLSEIDDRVFVIDDEVKVVRQKLMKAKNIDPVKMQDEIDDFAKEIEKLKKANDITQLYDFDFFDGMWTGEDYFTDDYVKHDVDKKYKKYQDKLKNGETLNKNQEKWQGELEEFYKKVDKIQNNADFSKLYDFDLGYDFKGKDYFTDLDTKKDVDEAYKDLKKMAKSTMDKQDKETLELLEKFFDEVDKIQSSSSNNKELKKLQKELEDKQKELEKIRKRYGLDDDKFSQKRKDEAYWFTDKNGGAKGADEVLRDKCGEIWQKASISQRKAAYEYTNSYHQFNEPLRGIEYGTGNFIGVGKIDFEDIGVSTGYGKKPGQVKKLIDDLTDIIDNSIYDFDYWVQRGCTYNGMDKFFNIEPDDFSTLSEKEMREKLLGTTPTEYAFMSTGVSKGKGLNVSGTGITLNIYAPKGTKMLYCEPFSAFGNGAGYHWDGKSTQSYFSYEAELLLQRNTKFRVTKVEKKASRWFIDMEVISQDR